MNFTKILKTKLCFLWIIQIRIQKIPYVIMQSSIRLRRSLSLLTIITATAIKLGFPEYKVIRLVFLQLIILNFTSFYKTADIYKTHINHAIDE